MVQVFTELLRCLQACYLLQSIEIEQLRAKLKQYSDYDELKRELEIMKVRNPQSGHID